MGDFDAKVVGKLNRTLDAIGVEELESSGRFFTWTNSSRDGRLVRSKIDRMLVNQTWFDLCLVALMEI